MDRFVFVGPGRLGLALGTALVDLDPETRLLYRGRRNEALDHPLFDRERTEYRPGIGFPDEGTRAIFLTVPDDELPEIVASLAAAGSPPSIGCAVFHCSGALGAELLAPLRAHGYVVGTFHPLRSVAGSAPRPDLFAGTFFALSGDPEAMALARRIVALLRGRAVTIPPHHRPRYHAAAVLASNYLVVLLGEAISLLMEAGFSEEDATDALTGLAAGSVEQVREVGVVRALTGPLIRGDIETIELHLRSLEPETASFYAALGRRGLAIFGRELPDELRHRMTELFERFA